MSENKIRKTQKLWDRRERRNSILMRAIMLLPIRERLWTAIRMNQKRVGGQVNLGHWAIAPNLREWVEIEGGSL